MKTLITPIFLNITRPPKAAPKVTLQKLRKILKSRSKKPLAFLLCLFMVGFGYGQNLVQNPSFEEFVLCPSSGGQIDRATNWSSFGSSPEYFNRCSTSQFASIPNNYVGYQEPISNDSYIGIIAYEKNISVPSNVEFIGQQLLTPLSIDQKYYASFKINLPRKDTSTFNVNDCIHFASNKLGMLFTTLEYDEFNPIPINNFAHIYSDLIITDTLNWTTIGGSFIADQAYTYFSIGTFYDNSFIDTIKIYKNGSSCEGMSYYYIDDVALSTDSIAGLQLTSIKEITEDFFTINQVDNFLKIKSDKEELECLIYSSTGKLVYESKSKFMSLNLDISDYEQGMYFVKIIQNNNYANKKILILN